LSIIDICLITASRSISEAINTSLSTILHLINIFCDMHQGLGSSKYLHRSEKTTTASTKSTSFYGIKTKLSHIILHYLQVLHGRTTT